MAFFNNIIGPYCLCSRLQCFSSVMCDVINCLNKRYVSKFTAFLMHNDMQRERSRPFHMGIKFTVTVVEHELINATSVQYISLM
jgi:hypothetical protein